MATTPTSITAPMAPAELVVVADPQAGLIATPGLVYSLANADVSSLQDILSRTGATLSPLFGPSRDRVKRDSAPDVADLRAAFFHVEAPQAELANIASALSQLDVVTAAYVKPGVAIDLLNDMVPNVDEAPAQTPNFVPRQTYLGPAPAGVDAEWAWTRPGGRGQGVSVIDIEGAWRFGHEDLLEQQGGLAGGVASADLGWRNHGTAVIGVIGGDRNSIGITGISPDANVRGVSIFTENGGASSARAITKATQLLSAGDIMLIELHRPGPRFNFQAPNGQAGFIAIEWWPDDFEALRAATAKGIIVVEAAGNGFENLDDAIYDTNPASPYGPFPAWWKNPFRRSPLDSGAVIVGAGAPPAGTHGRDHGPDRSRLGFSNFGALVDVQGWGREVTTAGYGDLQGGASEDLWYTDQFSGTSSASPCVVGALACVQGTLRASNAPLLTPQRAREVLRATGSAQQDGPGRPKTQRIGNRPNLRQLISSEPEENREEVAPLSRVQFRGSLPANATQRWFTHDWPIEKVVYWSLVPVTPNVPEGRGQLGLNVQYERTANGKLTYWLTVSNATNRQVDFDCRYTLLG